MLFFLNELFQKQVRINKKPNRKQNLFPSCKSSESHNQIYFKGHCDCGAQQQQWFLFDPLHAYAEYIIEYEYLFSVRQLTCVLFCIKLIEFIFILACK
jgi:hypothetical protein